MARPFTGPSPHQEWLPPPEPAGKGQPGEASPPKRQGRHRPLAELDLNVITPLFGGGATTREVDSELPIRGSVRGQLRFWWRACRAPRFPDVQSLFVAESALWGSTETPASLVVTVRVTDTGHPAPYAGLVQGADRPLTYALFPFQQNQQTPAAVGQEGVRFRLTLSVAPWVDPKEDARLRGEAEATLWAWITFGGIGRARVGAVARSTAEIPASPPTQPAALAAWLQARAEEHAIVGTHPTQVPILAGARFVTGRAAIPAREAWREAVRPFQDLRQRPGVGCNEGTEPNRPGRSRWPEPDSVRERLGPAHHGHYTPVHPGRPLYPRADLGLPIIFQRIGPQRQEPFIDVKGEVATRFASPFILKPLALSQTQAVPLVLCLNAPHVWEGPPVVLHNAGADLPLTAAMLGADPASLARVAVRLEPLRGQSSVRALVLAYFAERWNVPEVMAL